MEQTVLRSFSNIGFSAGRVFSGFPDNSKRVRKVLEPRGSVKVCLSTGDLLSFLEVSPSVGAWVVVFEQDGRNSGAALGLKGEAPVSFADFNSEQIVGWLAARGKPCEALAGCQVPGETVLKAERSVTAWVISPTGATTLVDGQSQGTIIFDHQPADPSRKLLPEPLGDIRDEFTIKRGTAAAYEVKKGEFAQVIDVDGQQCSDFQALRARGLDSGQELEIDSTATRSMVRAAYPAPGLFDKFFDAELRPMMRVVQDTCGQHDTFGLACTARGYEERGFPGHVNCSDNISGALARYDVKRRAAWPAINFFWNTWIGHDHQLQTAESFSRPGDNVVMEALDDLVCVSTACPDDLDPINGWNPTDIHVRIYRPEAKIQRAVAYRAKEDAPMLTSEHSAFHPRLEALTTQFAPARDLWAATSFPSHGTIGEYWACRDAVTLQDMSGLRKFDVVGPDAERLLQLALTRDIARLSTWRGTYALMCDESGHVIDDGTLFRIGQELFRWCCGTEESGRWLEELAAREGLQVRIHDMRNALPNLALQGPRSRDLLRDMVFTQPHVPSLDDLKWFGVTVARLHDREGAPFMLARSGYTGELGYEVFCARTDAIAVWDAICEAGEKYGLKPMGSAALETIRIEAGLAAANAEFAPGVDAFEAGLGFAVNLKKTEFIGKEALARNAEAPRRVLKGLKFACSDVPHAHAPVLKGEREVGVVTSAAYSPTFECAIAMVRLSVEAADVGQELDVGMMDGRMKRIRGVVTDIPFVDPKREKARA